MEQAVTGSHGMQLLSAGQKRLWFLHRRDPSGSAYTEAWVGRIVGNLNIGALAQSLDHLVGRHEALRTSIVEIGAEPWALVQTDTKTSLSCVGGPICESEIQQAASDFISQSFDLSRGVCRTALFSVRDGSHVLVLAVHHIACDGLSFDVMQRELAADYAAIVTCQPRLSAHADYQYSDFVSWQRSLLEGGERERQLAYWREQLSPLPELARVPRMGAVVESRAEIATAVLPPQRTRVLERLAATCGTSPMVVAVAVYFALLHRLSGETDLSVGTPVTNRMPGELQGIVGFTVNTVVLRVSAEGDPRFVDFLKRVRDVCSESFDNADLPFEEVVATLGASERPLFQGMITFTEGAHDAVRCLDLDIRPIAIPPRQLKFDMSVDVRRSKLGWDLTVQARPDQLGTASAHGLLESLMTMLNDVAARPEAHLSSLAVLDRAAREAALKAWSGRRRVANEVGIAQRIDLQAARSPRAIALSSDRGDLDYGSLVNWAAAVQKRLAEVGVAPGGIVPIVVQGAREAVVAMLAVLRSGAAFAPVDPRWPKHRIEQLRFRSPTVVLDPATADRLPWLKGIVIAPPTEKADAISVAVGSEDPAYVFSTSGSTGEPKCVVCLHGALVNRFDWMDDVIGAEAGARVLQTTPFIYDSVVWQCLWPLTLGGTVVLSDDQPADGAELARTIAKQRITLVDFVPSILNYFVAGFRREPQALASLRTVILGGERLDASVASALRAICPHIRILNLYGPTEATIGCIWHEIVDIPNDEPIPIGLPIDNVEAVILDSAGQPCRIGQRGELYLGGRCLARGYLDDPEMTASRFIENPFPELDTERLFRSGDLAYRSPDGTIVCLGRTDEQIKIRGLRIDPGEIEAVLVGTSGVLAAAVVAKRTNQANTVLAAYVVSSGVTDGDLFAAMRARLPREMIPTSIVAIDQMPMTPSGKIDRQALAALPMPRTQLEAGARPPSPIAEMITALYAAMLNVAEVNQEDSFFALGGHSLLAIRLMAMIQDSFGVALPLESIFEHPTALELARVIDHLLQANVELAAAPEHEEDARTWPMSVAQSKMYHVERMLPGSHFFVNGRAYRIEGNLDVQALRRALNATIGQHPILGSHVVDGLEGAMFGFEPVPEPSIRVVDGHGKVEALLSEDMLRPFELAAGPLFRTLVVRAGPREHFLLLCVHHMIADAWSLDVVVHDLVMAYRVAVGAAPPAVARAERVGLQFARWQRKWLASPEAEKQLDFWRTRLAKAPAELPRDASRSSLSRFSVGRVSAVIDAGLLQRLRIAGCNSGCTLYVVLLATLSMLLREVTGRDDVRIGTAVSLRGRAEYEAAVGLFINMLTLDIDLAGSAGPTEVISVCRSVLLDAYRHRAAPFEWVIERLRQEAPAFEFPFNAVLLFQEPPGQTEALPGIEIIEPVAEAAKDYDTACSDLDLSVQAMHSQGQLRVLFEYKTCSFERERVTRWLARYLSLLDSWAGAVSTAPCSTTDVT
ncbi:amino acid adenylation domain-containing protein [Bradyrhizobium ontarionense]|uniref:Amino acid adenylation domain-containing protein n=1 Tax=Bradyrhizobium ontarionense TaxID=2898149 RepID=A0ABY3R7K7_9BRAD|nr:non-ribosomal peptide synthetase [Bradyrhizobium sp. A19]UFZ03316.1 amino acid adenylation domain-containing protein [Bradyrhizobium sp. A19]